MKALQPLVGLVFALSTLGPVAGEHPTLIQAKTEMCKVCHEDLLENRSFSHSPVEDDCEVCHQVTQGEQGTAIGLSEPEPQLCFMCHDGFEDAVNGDLASPHAPVMGSCLFCHEVHGSEHPGLLAGTPGEVCAECHESADIAPSHSERLPEDADCLGCHLPHGGPNEHLFTGSEIHPPFSDGSCDGCHRQPFGVRVRMRNRGEQQCSACHGSFEVPQGGTVHAAMADKRGRPGCLDCHDPHMSNSAFMLKADGPVLCGSCHAGVEALVRGDNAHFPATEDCLGCHAPHVSETARLLLDSPRELCLGCHDATDEDLSGKHLGADLAELECISCHNPHGSEYGKSLARNVHPPILDGCDTCHEGGHDELMEDGEPALCLICHDDIGEAAKSAQVPHMALEVARCVDCHNAHASPNERLVLGSGGQVCAECHDAQAPESGEIAHGAIERFGCQACHLPHGGDQYSMLRVVGNDLCLGCHGVKTVDIPRDGSDVTLLGRFTVGLDDLRTMAVIELTADDTIGHPTGGHLVRGIPAETRHRSVETNYEGALDCLTCHDPHKGTGGYLFRWNAANRMEACSHCHSNK